MFQGLERVDEIEVETDSNRFERINPKIIYRDNSSLSFTEKFLLKYLIEYNGMMFLFMMSAGLALVVVTSLIKSGTIPVFFGFLIDFLVWGFLVYVVIKAATYSEPPSYGYYIIGEDRIVEVSENEGRVSRSVYISNVDDIKVDDCRVSFQSDKDTIGFVVPDEEEIGDILDVIYNVEE